MTFRSRDTKLYYWRPGAKKGVAPLNTWYGYILFTTMIMVQNHPNYNPEMSKTLSISMHTQLWSATLVILGRNGKVLKRVFYAAMWHFKFTLQHFDTQYCTSWRGQCRFPQVRCINLVLAEKYHVRGRKY